jgi:hypothetical protein
MTITADFKNQVLQRLRQMPLGVDVPMRSQDRNYPETVEAIKIIIDWQQDLDHGFRVSFNNSYTAIRKTAHDKR